MDLNMIKSDMQKLGEEVFDRYGEEIFQALGVICFCRNLMQDCEMWKWTDNIWMQRADTEWSEESFQVMNWALENPEEWTDEKIPLGNFLISGVRLMEDMYMYEWTKKKEEWLGWMYSQILVNQYSGIRLFQEYIYLLGMIGIREGRSSQELLEMFRFAVPAGGQKAYDRGCEEIEHKLRKWRNTYIREDVEEQFDHWIKMVKGSESADVVALFNERYRTMPENEFCKWVENQLSEATDPEQLNFKLSYLAELFVYAERDVRFRLLKQLSDGEQEILLENWMKYFYPVSQFDLNNRMDRIATHVEKVRD